MYALQICILVLAKTTLEANILPYTFFFSRMDSHYPPLFLKFMGRRLLTNQLLKEAI